MINHQVIILKQILGNLSRIELDEPDPLMGLMKVHSRAMVIICSLIPVFIPLPKNKHQPSHGHHTSEVASSPSMTHPKKSQQKQFLQSRNFAMEHLHSSIDVRVKSSAGYFAYINTSRQQEMILFKCKVSSATQAILLTKSS